jgi:hypothetical protein
MSDGTGFAPLTREALEEAAADLAAVGLGNVAAVVSEIAADTPAEAEFCPYTPGGLNAKSWHHSLEQRQRRRQRQRRITNSNGS